MSRAVSPLLGTILLVGITVLVAAILGATALGMAPTIAPPEPTVVSATADPDGRIVLVHEAGPPLDVRSLTLRVSVDGTRLDHQPPVPFFSATGFHPGPTGPFNTASDPTWNVGERASFRVAGTNDPPLSAGATVTVRVFRDGTPLATAEARV